MAKKRIISLILVFVMIVALLPNVVSAEIGGPDTLHQLLFLSDIHSGTYEIDRNGIPCSQFSNLKYMLANLKAEGLNPEAVTCGGDYTRDEYGDYSNWNDMFNVINGTIKSNFPNAQANYTMGNHEWETMSLGAGSDKEALFEKIFGYPRCGLRMETDDYAIYQIGAQGNSRAGVDKEIFFTQDIQALDDYLATQIGQQRVIFIQTHWPIHSGWNFNYRNITNADLMIQTLNKYSEYMDIVYFWGHNHYGDPMRQTVKKAGDTITYYAQQGQPNRTRSAQINFTYVSTGCMNDMWNLQTGGFDQDPGPGVCSFVEMKADKLVINYRHVENTLSANPVYDSNANFKSYRPNENVNRIDPPQVFENPSRIEIPLLHTEFGGAKQYAVKVTNGRGGVASADVTMCAAGEEVTLTAAPKDGFHFKEWQVVGDTDVTITDGKFIMPEGHVAVKAVFESNSMAAVTTYELADAIEAGERYVVVVNGYALRAQSVTDSVVAEGNSLASVAVTVEDDQITSDVTDNMIWTFAEGSSPDAPGYEGYYITSNEGKLLYRNRLGGRSAANLILSDMPAASSINRVFWIARDLDDAGTKSLIQIGQTSNSGDYVFFLQASAESFNAPYSQRDAWETSYSNYPVKLYKVTENTPAGLPCIDFTDPAEESKFEIINSTGTSIVDGTGLKLVCTRPAFETCNNQNSGDNATNPADVVAVPVNGDWSATLTVNFSTGSASNGYYQFFGFYASEGEDYQNLAGIRGGDGAMQNFLRLNGNITADSADLNSAPGFASAGTYYLRLTKEGTSYICERSSNGEDFTTMFTYEDTGIEADQILIDAYTGMTTGYEFTLKALDFEGGQSAPACTHETTVQNAAEATCTEAGYTGDAVCTKCGKVVEQGTVIDALGHDWDDGVVTKPATETEDGVLTYTCSRCDASEAVVIPALGTTDTVTGYVLADKIEAGEKYVIVANGYALNSNVVTDSVVAEGNSLGSTAVTVDGNKITSEVADNMVWTFAAGTSPDAPGYEGFYITANNGKLLYRNRLGGRSAANLTLNDMPAASSINRVFWIVKDVDNAGTKSLVQIGQTSNSSDYVFFLQASAESFNAPYSQRDAWETSFSNYPVKLYKLTEASEPEVPEEPEELAIVTEPASFVGKVNETAAFAVEVNRSDVTYQWMFSNNGGKTWNVSTLAGNDTAAMAIAMKAFRVGQLYKVVVTDSTGASVESAVVSMTTASELKIVENPADSTAAVGETASFSVKAEGEGLTYQWKYSNNGGKTWSASTMAGSTTAALNVPVKAYRVGQMYKCVVTDANGNIVESAAALIG